MRKQIGFLKTTAIGGLIFLLPLIVLAALLGQVVQIVIAVAEVLGEWLPVNTPGGWATVLGLAVLAIVLACFFAGLAARRSFARRFSETIEKNLSMIFPRYVILKDQMAGTLGGNETKPQLKPIWVRLHDRAQLALEVERGPDSLVTVYLPGSPDPWAGSLVYLKAAQVESLDVKFADAVGICEQLGRGSTALLVGKQPAEQPLGPEEA